MPALPALIIGGSALAGGAIAASATSKASKAASDAAAQNAAIEQQQYQQTRTDLAPYSQAGVPAVGALQSRLGLTQQAAPAAAAAAGNPFAVKAGASTIPATPYAPATSAPAASSGSLTPAQIQQIEQQRPDVAAEAQKALANGSAQQHGATDVNGYVNLWYNQIRPQANDTYALPASTDAAATPAAPVPGQTMTSSDNGGLGDRATLARPTFTDAQPTIGTGPMSADYTNPANFTTSPGYQFRLDQGLRADNASYGARGLLKSDAAIKGLNDYAQGMASSEYGNWFNQQMSKLGADQGQYNTDRNTGLAQYNQNRNVFNTNYNADTSRYDSNFNADRGYNTDQYNTYTGNLFNLAGIGQSAAAGTANAGANYANAATANNNSLASVKGNAAIAGANGINGAINSGLQAYGAYSNPFSQNLSLNQAVAQGVNANPQLF